MKKLSVIAVLLLSYVAVNAQFAEMDLRLKILEEKKGVRQNIKSENLSGKKFVLLKTFEDHNERLFMTIDGDKATYAEVFDDLKTGQTSSNVFQGDVLKTDANVLSFRFDTLEGEKIALPLVKNLLLTKQKSTLYLLDVNTKDRWIDESALASK